MITLIAKLTIKAGKEQEFEKTMKQVVPEVRKEPGNRAYFRWGADATRGQMAKIAAQTFFPNCATPARR